MKGNHVPETVEPSEIDHDKEDGHRDGGGSEEFPKDDNLFDRLEMIDVSGNDQQDGSGSRSDQIRKIGNVKTPGNLIGHVRCE